MSPNYLKTFLIVAAVAGAALYQTTGHAAKGRSFDLKHGHVKLDVPANWQDVTDLFGIPLMFLGPEKGGGRPVITVVPTGIKEASFDPAELKKNEEDYRDGRREWLKKYNGSVVAFNDYATEKFPGASEAHSIGYRYKIDDVEFAEKSYYVVCKSQFYHLKTVLRGQHEKEYAGDVNAAVKSFTCE